VTWRPLDPLGSIKVKFGAVIVGAVAAAIGALVVTARLDVPLVVSAPAVALVALGVVQVLAAGMTAPLRDMARAAAAMATGDYDQRVTATSRDEVGDLARAFNQMAADLAAGDRARRDLVANVSHELRTPIAALRAVLENLVDGVGRADPPALEGMLRQVERLGRLAEQLLELSRLEAGAVTLDRRPVRLADLAHEAVQDARLRGAAADLAVHVAPVDLAVDGDPERLYEVVANLLANAVRFSPPGGRVEVWGRRADGRAVLEVCDQGPGIPADQRDLVFQRFARADPGRPSAGGGAGLGLAIVAEIVQLHGGTVRAEPASPTGCRMVVTLPEASP